MFIVFGTKDRQKEKGGGHFCCPQCEGEREYKHYQISTYFTLYFIPIFPVSNQGEYVECEACHSQYHNSVLEFTQLDLMLQKTYAELITGTPVEMTTKKLHRQGYRENDTNQVLTILRSKHAFKTCHVCHIEYLAEANLAECLQCQGELR